MKLQKLYRPRLLLLIFVLVAVIALVGYAGLSNRHQAIVKTRLLHGFGIIDNDWEVTRTSELLKLESPELLVDEIYESMDGPQALLNLTMNEEGSDIRWIRGFKAEVFREGTSVHNNDFLCHTNIDFFNGVHYKNLNLPKRINSQYPRLGTLSNGINQLKFPDGFGFPVAGNEKFIVASRTLNHNIKDAFFKVKHHIEFDLAGESEQLKPLLPKALVLLQDYNRESPYSHDPDTDPNLCLPLDLKNHSYPNEEGVRYAAHWVLPKGRHEYVFDVTYQLRLTEETRIHAMAAHLHPWAQSFTLYDATAEEAVFTINCENYSDKRGLKHVPVYSDEQGLAIYPDHTYELRLVTENEKEGFSDMMAVLFVYLYDREMDEHLRKLNSEKSR